ncbi:uncharacterized protein LOC134186402 [Corticium candelabrum]|uniref:uncharacterized protein LOC134186402 n=1 Tax=Corticium candelabrum TaxID=121492 RepID=UPI002E25D8F1|nr:uncharacterized protein LOC134186402 [Corticium candelabrum]
MFMGAYSKKYKERERDKRLMRRDLLRQGHSDHCDAVRRASRETARRQRMLDEKKRSDEEAEMRRREEVLEQRRQQQREGMNMMRSHRKMHSGKKNGDGNSKQQEIDVQFYGKAGLCKSLTHGVTKLNGVRIVQGSRVEMTSRPWKTSHMAFGLEGAARAVSNNKPTQADIQVNRDSLEGTPISPDEEMHPSVTNTNSDVRDVLSYSAGNGPTAAFMKSHTRGHRAVQSSDLALEDVATDDVLEGNGRDVTLLRIIGRGDEQKRTRDAEVDVSMDSIEGEVDINEVNRDEHFELKILEKDHRESHKDQTSGTSGYEAAVSDYRDSSVDSHFVSAGGQALSNKQMSSLWRQTPRGKPLHCASESQSSNVNERAADALRTCEHEQPREGNTHVTSVSSLSVNDSLDNTIQQESKSHVTTSLESRKFVMSNEDLVSNQSVSGGGSEERRMKSQYNEMSMKRRTAVDGLERNQGKHGHLFMSSVVMNTPASSTVQAALSQYLASQSSETINHVTSISSRNSSLLTSDAHSAHARTAHACTQDVKIDTLNVQPSVAIATKPVDNVEKRVAGYRLREVASEQKLTGILKKSSSNRPSSASRADMLRSSSCDKAAAADIMKKTVRFADVQQQVKASSPLDDYPHGSSVRFRRKRAASAPANSRTARQQDTERVVVQHEALSVVSVARKASQNRQNARGYSRTTNGHTTTRRVWEPKVVIKSESSGSGDDVVQEESRVDDEERRDEDKIGQEQVDVDQLDVDVGASIALDKTPTDDEINQLWNTVRARLQHESSYDTLKGLISSTSRSTGETARSTNMPATSDGSDTAEHQSTKQTTNVYVRNRSQLTNRPTMAARVFTVRDPPQDSIKPVHAAMPQTQTPVTTSQSASHLPLECGFVETSLYSDSRQTVMSRQPVYVRHYQQQAEMALARGLMRMLPTAGRSNGLPGNVKEGHTGYSGGDRVMARNGQSQAMSNGKKPMSTLSIEEMQVLRSLERLNSKLDEKKAVMQSAHNAVGGATFTVKTIQPQQRQNTSTTTGASYRTTARTRSLSDMPKTRVRRNPQAVAAAAIAAAQSRNSRTQPHVPVHRQAYYNM